MIISQRKPFDKLYTFVIQIEIEGNFLNQRDSTKSMMAEVSVAVISG